MQREGEKLHFHKGGGINIIFGSKYKSLLPNGLLKDLSENYNCLSRTMSMFTPQLLGTLFPLIFFLAFCI